MAFCDFVVKYDPGKDSIQEVTRRILYSIFVKRIKAKKPVIIFLSGDSGEGKSLSALALENVLLGTQGIDYTKYIKETNVFTPVEYPEKLDNLLFNKDLKKVNFLCVHEARTVVSAKLWYSFVNQSISDINTMTRAVKRLIVVIISQFIRDITPDVRYTLNYYITVKRPKNKPARLNIHVMWKDDRDLENPKLRKRKLSGYLVYPNGRYRRFVPKYFEVQIPDKEIVKQFDELDFTSKVSIIKNKMSKLMSEIRKDVGEENQKLAAMAQWYLEDVERLYLIGKRYRGKWVLKPNIKEMHGLDNIEAKEFESLINKKLKEGGYTNEANTTGEL